MGGNLYYNFQVALTIQIDMLKNKFDIHFDIKTILPKAFET